MHHWLEHIAPNPRHVGSLRHTAGWVEPQRFLHDHQLVLFARGDFDVELPSQTVNGRAGTFLIIPPGVDHVSRLRSRTGRRCWVHFDWTPPRLRVERPLMSYPPRRPEEATLCLAPSFVPRGMFYGPIPSPAVLERHREMERLWKAGRPQERLLARGVLLQLLVELLGPGTSRPASSPDRVDRRIRAIRTRLDQLAKIPVDETPSLQRELESLGWSYAHACRAFRAAYGLTPLAYTHRLRIERAKLLLRKGCRPVWRVGQAVGIRNPVYFSRLFRDITGLSPRRYLEKYMPPL